MVKRLQVRIGDHDFAAFIAEHPEFVAQRLMKQPRNIGDGEGFRKTDEGCPDDVQLRVQLHDDPRIFLVGHEKVPVQQVQGDAFGTVIFVGLTNIQAAGLQDVALPVDLLHEAGALFENPERIGLRIVGDALHILPHVRQHLHNLSARRDAENLAHRLIANGPQIVRIAVQGKPGGINYRKGPHRKQPQ